jgi:MerR family Zn(II)-responsive transcriptional regulator of zntA
MKRISSGLKARRAPRRRSESGLLTLSQLADASGETVHAVRYYLREGLLEPSQVAANGYRLFDAAAQSRLRFVRRAQRLGFSLAEVRSFIHDARRGSAPCPRVRQLLQQRLPVISAQLTEMMQLHERMTRASRRWRRHPDTVPTGAEVCRLIESAPDH